MPRLQTAKSPNPTDKHVGSRVCMRRKMLKMSQTVEQHSIDKRAENLPVELQEFLADELSKLDSVSRLGDQLAIVALYRVVEINTGRMLGHAFGPQFAKKASRIDAQRVLLKDKLGINIESVPHYRAIDELRLLNNSIKHAGRVTKSLADQFGRWKEGQELTGLDEAYGRLRHKVPAYIFRLAELLKLRFK
jgi:hypothetical protein